MKKMVSLILAFALVLAACGKSPEKEVDLQSVFNSLTEKMPEMLVLDETIQLNLLGIDSTDCQQVITAICADSVQADEIWLIQAKNTAALEKLTALAKTRVEAQAEVCESYSPDQYAIVKRAELVTSGLYLALLIGPDAASMKKTFTSAIG